jgi:hypothetical protein
VMCSNTGCSRCMSMAVRSAVVKNGAGCWQRSHGVTCRLYSTSRMWQTVWLTDNVGWVMSTSPTKLQVRFGYCAHTGRTRQTAPATSVYHAVSTSMAHDRATASSSGWSLRSRESMTACGWLSWCRQNVTSSACGQPYASAYSTARCTCTAGCSRCRFRMRTNSQMPRPSGHCSRRWRRRSS